VDLALVVNPDKPGTLRAIARTRACVGARHTLRLHGEEMARLRARRDYAGEADGLAETDDVRSADAVVSLGGDGTLLHAVALLQGSDRPLLGINLGGLGFLTDATEHELETSLERLVGGRFRIDRRMLVEARFEPRRGAGATVVGLNDAVVHAPQARMLELSLRVGGVDLGSTRADGVIVATPSGSTAYSLSAGGPVVSPRIEALVVTPISPHTLSLRPLVVGADEEIEMVLESTAADSAELTIDGQQCWEMAPGDRVTVRRAPHDLQLVVTHDRTFYDTLRTKLGWGQRDRGGA
jgi:NAD+ kinase